MTKKALQICLFFLLYQNFLSSQIIITGKISDNRTKEALVGATVRIGEQGSVTDIQGGYKIELSKTGSFKATISFVGYENLEKKHLHY